MGRKSNYSIEEKLNAVLDYKNGKRNATEICNDLGLYKARTSLYNWIAIYDKYGESGLYPKPTNNSYSKVFKEKVAKAYLDGEGSMEDLKIKYDIGSSETVRKWILSYNSHIELKDYHPKGEVYMTKSRKTTLQERIDIVTYCLENNKAYKLVAKVYDVSYTQVYQWTQKYLVDGEEGLVDKRGKHKPDEEIDQLTLLKRENERLKKQLELKEMENLLLKKVKEVERR